MTTHKSNGQLPTPGLSPEIRPLVIETESKDSNPTLQVESTNGTSDPSGATLFSPIDDTESILTPAGVPKDARYGADRLSVSDTHPGSRSQKEIDRVLKLSPAKLKELTASPSAVPLRAATPLGSDDIPTPDGSPTRSEHGSSEKDDERYAGNTVCPGAVSTNSDSRSNGSAIEYKTPKGPSTKAKDTIDARDGRMSVTKKTRPISSRTSSTPPTYHRKHSTSRADGHRVDSVSKSRFQNHAPPPLNLGQGSSRIRSDQISGGLRPRSSGHDAITSPIHTSLPLPPVSMPTYLQLELSSEKPSPLYIHRSSTTDSPYESSSVKFQRLVNFLLLPPNFEQVLWFGSLACLDAWLYNFTILPLRFIKSVWIIIVWLIRNAMMEIADLAYFTYNGLGRLWRRYWRRGRPSSRPRSSRSSTSTSAKNEPNGSSQRTASRERERTHAQLQDDQKGFTRHLRRRHRRTLSTPSRLLPSHKADVLQGLLIVVSCLILLRFDASRMYHGIRGQAAMKLYVIFNVLEIGDRLLSAIGQDVMECLLSPETLERDNYGRSKVLRPFLMFLLALIYNVTHATALFYQVITLNVAVNSYSNALLTLLMSNQFVEIKSTVFKRLEKENLFQMTCADVVERFQLWLMMVIIAMRNIVELSDFTISFPSMMGSATASSATANATGMPSSSTTALPMSFTILPKWTGQVLGPFFLVLGSEMVVDWIKHAYINKFNNTRPEIYGRFLDVLAKDYYSNAFVSPNLTKRVGLPVIPLACLFIRSSLQTYHMFLATHMPLPIPSPVSSIALNSETTSTPAPTPLLIHLDRIFRRALGRSTFGAGNAAGPAEPLEGWRTWVLDDVIALATLAIVVLVFWLLLLAMKLLLGMVLLTFARNRYRGMKERERRSYAYDGVKRVGGWGGVEVDDEKRRWIYEGDEAGLRKSRERARTTEMGGKDGDKGSKSLNSVERYAMVAKRIW